MAIEEQAAGESSGGRTSSPTVSAPATNLPPLRTRQVWAPTGSGPSFATMCALQWSLSGLWVVPVRHESVAL